MYNILGFTSNGEHNSIRNRGYTRPLSVFQIRSDLRSKYSRMSERALADMLTPTSKNNWDAIFHFAHVFLYL